MLIHEDLDRDPRHRPRRNHDEMLDSRQVRLERSHPAFMKLRRFTHEPVHVGCLDGPRAGYGKGIAEVPRLFDRGEAVIMIG